MKSSHCLIFIIPFILLACQPPGSSVSTQSSPSPTSQTEPTVILNPSPTPSPTPTFTTTPSPTPEPSLSPILPPSLSSLRVVYTDESNIWLWQNGVATLLTTSEGYAEVKLSEDGQMVAFASNGQLWVINSDGTDERLLVSSDNLKAIEPEANKSNLVVYQFNWISDTHTLLFNTSYSGYGISHRDDLHKINVDTLEWKILRDAGEGGIFSISPNGKQVVMVTPHEISVMNVDGTNYRSLLKYSQIDTGSEYFYYVHPIWSTDSQSLIVSIPPRDYMDNPTTALNVIRQLFMDGRPPVQISQFPAQYRYLFSSDLAKLAYNEVKNDVDVNEIHIANIDGSGITSYQFEPDMSFVNWSSHSTSFVLISRKTNQYFLVSVGDEPIPLTEQKSQDLLWIDELHFLYKNILNGTCELRLGTIDKPSVYLATLDVGSAPYDCFKPYDFVQ